MLEFIFSKVLFMSLAGGIVIGVLSILGLLTKKYFSQRWHYYVWIIALILLVVPLSIPFQFDAQPQPASSAQVAEITKPIDIGTQKAVPSADENGYLPLHTPQVKQVIVHWTKRVAPLCWLVGFLILLLRQIIIQIKFNRAIREIRRSASDEQNQIMQRVMSGMNIKQRIRLTCFEGSGTPFVTGIIKPAIYIPNEGISDHELSLIIRHELMHGKRYDLLYKAITSFVVMIHWFNPLVYLMQKEVAQYCELSCDEQVVNDMDIMQCKDYSTAILMIMKRNLLKLSGSVALGESKKYMTKRIEVIMKNSKPGKLAVKLSVAMAVVLVLASMAFANGINGLNNAALPEGEQNKIKAKFSPEYYYEDGEEVLIGTLKQQDTLKAYDKNGVEKIVKRIIIDDQGEVIAVVPVENQIGDALITKKEEKFVVSCGWINAYNAMVTLPDGSPEHRKIVIYDQIMEKRIAVIPVEMQIKTPFEVHSFGYPQRWKVANLKFENEKAIPEKYKNDFGNYLANVFIDGYQKYYQLKGFEISNLKFNETPTDMEATFFFKMIHQNYYKDPDTVEYIRKGKESGSKHYQTLYNEYNQPHEANFDLKLTAKITGGRIDKSSIKLFTNVAPKGTEYIPVDETFFPD